MGWNALDAIDDETHRADGRAGIDGLQELVQSAQVPPLSARPPYSLAAVDGLIAATAVVHDLTLVTRNTTDFQAVLRAVLNPWS